MQKAGKEKEVKAMAATARMITLGSCRPSAFPIAIVGRQFYLLSTINKNGRYGGSFSASRRARSGPPFRPLLWHPEEHRRRPGSLSSACCLPAIAFLLFLPFPLPLVSSSSSSSPPVVLGGPCPCPSLGFWFRLVSPFSTVRIRAFPRCLFSPFGFPSSSVVLAFASSSSLDGLTGA